MQGRNLVQVSVQGEEWAIRHASSWWIYWLVVWILKSNTVILVILAKLASLWVVMCLAQIPESIGGVYGSCCEDVVLNLQSAD